MVLAAAAGGAVVVGYFIHRWLLLRMGLAKAVQEAPFALLQVAIGLARVPV
jgi:hypothetical protein